MSSSNIRAIIFDLGRVIVDVNISRLTQHLGTAMIEGDPQKTIAGFMRDPSLVDFGTGRITPRQFHRTICQRFGIDVSFERFSELWCDVFTPMPGMERLLRELEGRQPLGLLSDTDPLHWQHLRSRYPILSIFARPILSFEVGMMKPSPDIFRKAAESVATVPQECLYIDDLVTNVEGAKKIGMDAIAFSGANELRRRLFERGLIAMDSADPPTVNPR